MTEKQSTDTVLMISPDTFQFNTQTSGTNSFQQRPADSSSVVQMALNEFNQMVSVLNKHEIQVVILPSRSDLITPDAVFPNNWFSTHIAPDGSEIVVLYPMLAESRRDERQWDTLNQLLRSRQIIVHEVKDLSAYEDQNKYLEGTGSLVLDRLNKIAYAALSPRTSLEVLHDFCERMRYTPVAFSSIDKNGMPIYHTNVIMSIGTDFAVIAAETIASSEEREKVVTSLAKSGRRVLTIRSNQMEHMAGNILEVRSSSDKIKIILSRTAYNAFTLDQRQLLSVCGELVVVQIDLIEKLGGGSARCMLAEIFHT
jgi:hypothetical protein